MSPGLLGLHLSAERDASTPPAALRSARLSLSEAMSCTLVRSAPRRDGGVAIPLQAVLPQRRRNSRSQRPPGHHARSPKDRSGSSVSTPSRNTLYRGASVLTSTSVPSVQKIGSPGLVTASTGQGLGFIWQKSKNSAAQSAGSIARFACTRRGASPEVWPVWPARRINARNVAGSTGKSRFIGLPIEIFVIVPPSFLNARTRGAALAGALKVRGARARHHERSTARP